MCALNRTPISQVSKYGCEKPTWESSICITIIHICWCQFHLVEEIGYRSEIVFLCTPSAPNQSSDLGPMRENVKEYDPCCSSQVTRWGCAINIQS